MKLCSIVIIAVLAIATDAKHAYTRQSKYGTSDAVGRLEEKTVEAGKGGLCDANVTQYSGRILFLAFSCSAAMSYLDAFTQCLC